MSSKSSVLNVLIRRKKAEGDLNLDTQREESQTEMRDSSSAAQVSQETTSGWKKEGRPPGSLWPEWDPQGIFTVLLWPLQLKESPFLLL